LKPQAFTNAIATLITPVARFKEGHKPTMEEQAQLDHFNTTREINCGLIYRLWEVNLDIKFPELKELFVKYLVKLSLAVEKFDGTDTSMKLPFDKVLFYVVPKLPLLPAPLELRGATHFVVCATHFVVFS
jgi:hypothetical protein